MKTLYVPLTVDSNIGFLLWDSYIDNERLQQCSQTTLSKDF